MLMNKADAAVEKLMNEQGLSHAEAISQVRGKKKSKAPAPAEGSAAEEAGESPDEEDSEDESMETVDLPAALVPGASVGKEVDISVTGIVKSKSNGMVSVELSRTSGSSRDPMPAPKAVDYPR
jgi:hypothetical protein